MNQDWRKCYRKDSPSAKAKLSESGRTAKETYGLAIKTSDESKTKNEWFRFEVALSIYKKNDAGFINDE